jgi:hypothetical protein
MSDVNCPYCDAEVEINHDDGYGYTEGEIYTQECSFCDKTFTYTTYTYFCYDAEQAPCQNGEEHDFKPIKGYPEEYYVGKQRCSWCGEETIDIEANKEAMKKYWDRMENR